MLKNFIFAMESYRKGRKLWEQGVLKGCNRCCIEEKEHKGKEFSFA